MKERDSVYVKSGFIREGEHLYVVRHVMCSHVMACNGGEFCSRIPIFADLFANLSKRKRKSFWNSVPLLPRHKLIWAFENHRSRVFQQKIYFGNGLTFLSSQVWFENKSFSFLNVNRKYQTLKISKTLKPEPIKVIWKSFEVPLGQIIQNLATTINRIILHYIGLA